MMTAKSMLSKRPVLRITIWLYISSLSCVHLVVVLKHCKLFASKQICYKAFVFSEIPPKTDQGAMPRKRLLEVGILRLLRLRERKKGKFNLKFSEPLECLRRQITVFLIMILHDVGSVAEWFGALFLRRP